VGAGSAPAGSQRLADRLVQTPLTDDVGAERDRCLPRRSQFVIEPSIITSP
jgi:hypothetical protein